VTTLFRVGLKFDKASSPPDKAKPKAKPKAA
jgi:hypothetical protein